MKEEDMNMTEKRKIIGLVGLIGCGKDTVADYLSQKYDYDVIGMGDIVREISRKRGRTEKRYDLSITQKECVEKYGIEYFAQEIVKKIVKNNLKKVVINGIRRPEDAIVPKKAFGKEMILVLVDVSPEMRFKRMKKRHRTGDPSSFKEFMTQEKNEFNFFDLPSTLSLIEYKISNNGTKKQLEKNVEKLLVKTGFK